MRRINNIYKSICSIETLHHADQIARKGKSKQPGVIAHEKNCEANIQALHEMLLNKSYRTSEYTIFTITETKERTIYRLPYYPDRIVHHAVMLHLEKMFVSTFTADTYNCIKGKGIHAAVAAVRQALKDIPGTKYCLKLDIKKFYPNVDHDILKQLLRRKIKDQDLLWLLDSIIDSADGLPIGNYLSQYFANFYLCYFDHWIKEKKAVQYYFRYADDLVFLSGSKEYLHELLAAVRAYLASELKLEIKGNYQVFPIDPVHGRSLDFVGYCFYHTHTLIRKRIKQAHARAIKNRNNRMSLASYNGWSSHADTNHLMKKLYEKVL